MTNLLPSAPMLELLGKCQYRGLRALHFTESKQVVNLVSTPWSVARSRSVHEIPMRVIPVPCLSNNYAYILSSSKSNKALVVDPVEPRKVLDAAQQAGLDVAGCLTTHHHADHAGGNAELAALVPGIPIYGGAHDGVACCTNQLHDRDCVEVDDVTVMAVETPYHTEGHICYLCTQTGTGEAVLFSGDALFVGGCGRCCSGTPQQMYHSLIEVLAKLPPDTVLWCGHEYTVANMEFAASIEPNNPAVQHKLQWARAQREQQQPTVPSTMKEELGYNPFLRCQQPAVQEAVGESNPVKVLAALRQRKDTFGGLSAAVFGRIVNIVNAVGPLARMAGIRH